MYILPPSFSSLLVSDDDDNDDACGWHSKLTSLSSCLSWRLYKSTLETQLTEYRKECDSQHLAVTSATLTIKQTGLQYNKVAVGHFFLGQRL
jgi:hypothetical protein